MNILVVVDMQNDFNPSAATIQKIKEKVGAYHSKSAEVNRVLWTKDYHSSKDYFSMRESKYYPVHCLENSPGAELVTELKSTHAIIDRVVYKNSFMPLDLPDAIMKFDSAPYQIEVCGVCTYICVLNTALLLRAAFPKTRIIVDLDACGGSTEEQIEATRLVLEGSAVEVVGQGTF